MFPSVNSQKSVVSTYAYMLDLYGTISGPRIQLSLQFVYDDIQNPWKIIFDPGKVIFRGQLFHAPTG